MQETINSGMIQNFRYFFHMSHHKRWTIEIIS